VELVRQVSPAVAARGDDRSRGRGASAFPDLQLAFVTMDQSLTKFVNIAAHEMAHVIARNAEPFIGCAEADPLSACPNQATDAERIADTVSGKGMALPHELDGGMRQPQWALCAPSLDEFRRLAEREL
jgi:hypothetical protein